MSRLGSPLVLRGELLRALDDAASVRARIEREAADIRARAQEDADILRQAARQEGIEQAATLLADAGRAVNRFLAGQEEALGALAFSMAERILGALPREETLLRAVGNALAEHRAGMVLELRVAPALFEPLRAALSRQDGEASMVVLTADPALDGTACTMIHHGGRTAIGPHAQLDALRAAAGSPP